MDRFFGSGSNASVKPLDLEEVDRRRMALEPFWENKDFLRMYAGRYISVEKNDGKYRIISFKSFRKGQKYIDRSYQKHCMPALIYVQRENEIIML